MGSKWVAYGLTMFEKKQQKIQFFVSRLIQNFQMQERKEKIIGVFFLDKLHFSSKKMANRLISKCEILLVIKNWPRILRYSSTRCILMM